MKKSNYISKIKRVTVFLSLSVLIVITSCKKESVQVNYQDSKFSGNPLTKDFKATLDAELLKLENSQQKNNSVEFPDNPYDKIGALHNQLVEHIYVNGYLEKSMSELISELAKETGLEFTMGASFYSEMIVHYDHMIYREDRSYNPEFINGTEIPALEKEFVNTYFDMMTRISDVNIIISLSKEAEIYVLNSRDFSEISKQRLLTCFAVYRYSSYFWSDKYNNEGMAYLPCGLADAIGAYIATHGDFEPGVIEDGAAVNNFAATFSSIYGWCFF